MAIRFDASGESLSRTTNLPTITAFTLMGWFYISTDRNAYSSFFGFGDSSGFDTYYLGTGTDGVTLITWNAAVDGPNGTTLSTATWYHAALVCDGTGGGNLRAYLNGVLDSTHDGGTEPAAQALYVGNNLFGDWLSGRVAAIKLYSAALTAAEIAQEMRTIVPRRTANLNSWYPCFPGASERLMDYSGNGYTWTANGTVSDEDPPPVSWGGKFPDVLVPPPAGGTTYEISPTGAVTPTGALVKGPAKTLTGSLTPAGAVTKLVSAVYAGALTPTGAALKTGQKLCAGGLTPASTLAAIKTALLTLTGSLTPTGALSRVTSQVLAGSLTPTGALVKTAAKALTGALTPTSTLTTLLTHLLSLTGSLTPTGSLVRSTLKSLAGTLTPLGSLATSGGTIAAFATFLQFVRRRTRR